MGYEEATTLAHELVHAVAGANTNVEELSASLAIAVGEALEPYNRLVAAVLAGGPFTVRRALELAELLIAPDAVTVPSKSSG